MTRIVVLGSTGSIGRQVLDVASRLGARIEIAGLCANSNTQILVEQANRSGTPHVCICDAARVDDLRHGLARTDTRVYAGVDGMCKLATLADVDLVVVAVAGAIGIAPTHAALRAGKDVALASKEVLVAAGEATMDLATSAGTRILPIDSEHSAIFQCLQGAPGRCIERIVLTASGGPFRDTPMEDLIRATPAQALRHPTWNMGDLVTINSATLMNKALEIIEARWLFGVPAEHIDVTIHRQSIVHSMVRFCDGSTMAQLGLPDMRLPIQYALTYPDRVDSGLPRMGLDAMARLTFEEPDETRFPALALARRAIAGGGTMPAVMNAANEASVSLFLNRQIRFPEITEYVESAMRSHEPVDADVANVLNADRWARDWVGTAAARARTDVLATPVTA